MLQNNESGGYLVGVEVNKKHKCSSEYKICKDLKDRECELSRYPERVEPYFANKFDVFFEKAESAMIASLAWHNIAI